MDLDAHAFIGQPDGPAYRAATNRGSVATLRPVTTLHREYLHGLCNKESGVDDIGDLEVIRSVGLAAAVADAHPLIKQHSHFVCEKEGGKGAVREFIEFILESQKKWGMVQEKVKDLFNRGA